MNIIVSLKTWALPVQIIFSHPVIVQSKVRSSIAMNSLCRCSVKQSWITPLPLPLQTNGKSYLLVAPARPKVEDLCRNV